jgi:hypothetical protein
MGHLELSMALVIVVAVAVGVIALFALIVVGVTNRE